MSRSYWRLLFVLLVLTLTSCQKPKPPEVTAEPDVPTIERVYQEGREAYLAGKFDQATERFAHVVQTDPNHFNALVNWGSALSRDGKPQEAILKFQQALDVGADNPNRAEAYYNWGVALERLGKHQEAVEKFEQAIALKAVLLSPSLQRYLQRHGLQHQETQIGSPSSRISTPQQK